MVLAIGSALTGLDGHRGCRVRRHPLVAQLRTELQHWESAMGPQKQDVPAGVTTMKAIVQDVYGEADVLRLAEIDRPEPGDDDVLQRVHAAGVDRGVWHIMAGLPYPIRLVGYGFRVPKHRVRGREVARRVEAVGKNVTTLKPGDDAYGIAEGSFAEYAVGSADKLAPKPTNLTFKQAAATTISALTARQAVRDGGHVESGQNVLIIGASWSPAMT
jgi:NADPH:quinone reductase-like Zn-dependent oxidoreductase